MKKLELVVELGVEEIPASMLEDASRQFADILTESLRTQRLNTGKRTVWFTPRRIVVGLDEIPICQNDELVTIAGPSKSISYDENGEPTKAAMAFAKKNGVPLSSVRIIRTPKGEYLSIERRIRGEKTHSILERLIPASIGKIRFRKTMHWSPDQFRFIRPIRWIVALFGGRLVRFRIADVTSSRFTVGHRFQGKSRIPVSSLASLRQKLRENSVVVDPEERLTAIRLGLAKAAREFDGHPLDDPDLLKIVVNLNEAPFVVGGAFETRFLALPQEILVTVMREHQKYFSVVDKEGKLLPAFLTVVNLQSDQYDAIRSGHERVLRARLADAAFFWDTDRKTKLHERELSLKEVLFQEKLGSYFDKTQRVIALLPKIAQAVGRADLQADLETAGHIFKCDLLTEMVKEFTDLQGVVGGLYANSEGYSENVWQAVYQQYLPKSASDSSPSSDAGALLALADRLDTICGCFSVGLIPSGSKDPFAVRRQGNGILKIIFEHRFSVSLAQLLQWSLEFHEVTSHQTAEELRQFFEGRLRFLFEEMGYAHDCIHAILASGFDNPLDALERLKALHDLRDADDFLSLVSNFKRIANIISQAEAGTCELNESMLEDPAELALWQTYLKVRPEVEAARNNHDYRAALRSLASIRDVVDEFFDQVMVMSEDPAVRANRISLLNCVAQSFKSIVDISRMVVERES